MHPKVRLGQARSCVLVLVEATGTVPSGGGKVTFEIEKADPQNPTANRCTGKRFEKALNGHF